MKSSKKQQRGPIIVQTQPQRRGPGLLGTMAHTAVVAGTATATSKAVSNSMGGSSQKAAMQQQAMAAQQQAQLDAAAQRAVAEQQAMLAAQQAALAAQQPAAPTGLTDDKITQLTKLAELQQAGILTDEEFAAQKAKILAS